MVESESFEEFAVNQTGRLLRLAHALTGDPHDAWDLTQETLLRVAGKWTTIRRAGAEVSYARTTMIRLNIRRRRGRRREWLGEVPDQPFEPSVDQVPRVSGVVALALQGLGARQRTTLVLRYLYDMSLVEIATEMGCSLGTVKSQVHRAEVNFRKALASQSVPTT